MGKTLEIKVAVVVGSNGQYSVDTYRGDKTDWGFLSDGIGIYDKKSRETTYPDSERRYVVTATVEIPDDAPEIVVASSVAPHTGAGG